MKDKKLLEEICTEDGCQRNNCFLRTLMLHNGLDDKMVMQLKLVDKFKYEFSEIAHYNIGYEETLRKWVDEGYAAKYTEYWDNGDHTHHILAMYHALKMWKNEQ